MRLTVTPQGGFQGAVLLSLEGALQGVGLSPQAVNVAGTAPVQADLTLSAQAPTPADSIAAARNGPASAAMRDRAAKLTTPVQVVVYGQDYLFLANSPSPVTVSIDLQPALPLAQIDANHWMLLTKMRTGVLHQYQFFSAGKPLGNRGDAVGYNPDS